MQFLKDWGKEIKAPLWKNTAKSAPYCDFEPCRFGSIIDERSDFGAVFRALNELPDSAAPPHLSLGRNWIIAMYSEALRDLTPLASKTHLQIDTYSVPSSKALKNENVE